MSRKEIVRLLDHIEPQGVETTRTKNGILLRLPDKSSTMLHFTGSDHREADNVRARLRRSGVSWPTDGDPLSDRILSSKPQKATMQKVERALLRWEQRTITGAQLRRLMPEGQTLSITAAQAALYHLGWTPTGPTTARKWLRPLELEPEPVDMFPEDEPPAALAPLALVPDLSEPEPVAAPEPREFIDSVDSWAADLEQLPDTLTLGDVRKVLGAFGLQLELRTWRADA